MLATAIDDDVRALVRSINSGCTIVHVLVVLLSSLPSLEGCGSRIFNGQKCLAVVNFYPLVR